jgi:hypothetical protein
MNIPNRFHNSGKPPKRRLKPQALRAAKAAVILFSIVSIMIPQAVNVLAISPKGKSRIGTKLTTAIVEQDHHDKMFVVFNASQCRWIKKDNDPDFRIIGDD